MADATNTSRKGNILHKLKSQKELKKITDSKKYKDASYKEKAKMLGSKVWTAEEMKKKIYKKKYGTNNLL